MGSSAHCVRSLYYQKSKTTQKTRKSVVQEKLTKNGHTRSIKKRGKKANKSIEGVSLFRIERERERVCVSNSHFSI